MWGEDHIRSGCNGVVAPSVFDRSNDRSYRELMRRIVCPGGIFEYELGAAGATYVARRTTIIECQGWDAGNRHVRTEIKSDIGCTFEPCVVCIIDLSLCARIAAVVKSLVCDGGHGR